jgi:hypothetical protein
MFRSSKSWDSAICPSSLKPHPSVSLCCQVYRRVGPHLAYFDPCWPDRVSRIGWGRKTLSYARKPSPWSSLYFHESREDGRAVAWPSPG